MAAIFVTSPDEIPKGEHWAIIGSTSVHIPGDERSRTNPGHGYPESTERFITYEAYLNEDEFKHELERYFFKGRTNIRGMHVKGTYTSKTVVTLEAEL